MSIKKELLQHLAWSPDGNDNKTVSSGNRRIPNERYYMTRNKDRFIMSPVMIRGEYYRVEIAQEVIDLPFKYTQEGWLKFLEGTSWSIPSGPLMMSIMHELYTHKSDFPEIARQLIGELEYDFKMRKMITSTRVTYHATGDDTITHDFGQENSYDVYKNLKGKDKNFNPEQNLEGPLEALLGIGDLPTITTAFSNVTPHIPRLVRSEHPIHESSYPLIIGSFEYLDIFTQFNIFGKTQSNTEFEGHVRGVILTKL